VLLAIVPAVVANAGAGTSAAARTFFRIIRTDPPTITDFMSHAALGIPTRRRGPEALRLRPGISSYAIEAQARRKARGVGTLGAYIARLQVPIASAVVA
jgi:hypothetical protein